MDKPSSNWTCPSSEHDMTHLLDVAVSLLFTLKLGLIGIIYDDSVALEVSQLMPRLSLRSNAILFLADDIIKDQSVAKAYLDVVAKRVDSRSPVSLVITRDHQSAKRIFNSFSRHQASLGKQSGVGLYTKWLVAMPCDYMISTDEDLSDFFNVAAVVFNQTSTEAPTNGEMVIKTLIIKPEGRRFEPVGISSDGNLTLWSSVFPNTHRGFNAMHFIVGVYVWSPFTMRRNNSGIISYEGFSVDLVTELARRLNFRQVQEEEKKQNNEYFLSI
ncbi:glutamate receptor delta-1 subunit [Plakobranchus ocellatus]|uniref:Glutamate receptor delta-1 subunit n=1 Tax=Plakobranchus ocellatus TaxID=259542 RepID=A0AAV3ZCU9_9GAST|nr:glutamate receptor delta-1 subunit [Plakobranchus ocellatus]